MPCQPRHPLLQGWHLSPSCPGHTIPSLNSKSDVWGSDPGASIPRGVEGGSLHPSQSILHCFAAQRDVRNWSRSTSKQASRVNTTALVSGGTPAPGTGRRHFPSSLSEAAGCPWGRGPQGCLPASPAVLGGTSLCGRLPAAPQGWSMPGLVSHQHGGPPHSLPLGSCSGIRHIQTKLKPWGKAGSFCKGGVDGCCQGMKQEWFPTIPSPGVSLTLAGLLRCLQ